MNRERQGSHNLHVCSLWQDLSHHTIIFDLVTLTLKFVLLLKNFNLGHNFWTVRDRAFIFHMCIPCDNTFHTTPRDLDLGITYTKMLLFKFGCLSANFVVFWQLLSYICYICKIFVLKQSYCKYRKRLLLRCIHSFKSDLIYNIGHMRISGTEPS